MSTTEKAAQQPLMIGEILVQADIVQQHQLPRALQMAKDRSLRVGQILVMMRYLSDEELEPILEIQKLINDGSISSEAAIDALKIMRRDGLPLTRAVEQVQAQPANRDEKLALAGEIEKNLRILEESKEVSDREIVPGLLKLGDVRLDLRDFEQAERHYKRALAIGEHSLGMKTIKILPTLRKLQDLYMLQQRYAEAEALCWRSVEIHQTVLGPDHLETAHAVHKLARVLDAQRKSVEAEQFLLSAIRIMEKQLGVEHPELKLALRHFSAFWKRKSKKTEYKRIGELLVEAELVTQDNLSAALQESHQTAVPVGQVLVKMGAISGEVLRAGLQAQLLVQDGVIPAAVAVKALRVVSSRQGSLEDALDEMGWSPDPVSTKELQKLMHTADELMAAERALGANHPGVAVIALKLGEQCMHARKYGNAESAYKRALHILRQTWGQSHIELTDTMFKLANLYYVQRRYTESESAHWQVLAIRKEALGDRHVDVVHSLEAVAKVQEAQGNVESAQQMRQAAAALRSVPATKAEPKKTEPPAVPQNLAFVDVCWVLTEQMQGKTGYLLFSDHKGKQVGKLAFKQGDLFSVNYRHLKGPLALLDLVSREDPLDFKFEPGEVAEARDERISEFPVEYWLKEAKRRADELPGLLEEVGWPRTSFCKLARVLDTSSFNEDFASVAADIWMFIEDDTDNSQMIEGVHADRWTFLVALRDMLKHKLIARNNLESTGSFGRLSDLLNM